MLNTIIQYHKRKLEKMLDKNVDYDKIIKQSQILDKHINKKMKEYFI